MADELPPIGSAVLRRYAVRFSIDPRTIRRELHAPGSVGGMAGERARAAVAALRAETIRVAGVPTNARPT